MSMTTRSGLILIAILLVAVPASGQEFEIEAPEVVLTGIPFDIVVHSVDGPVPARLAQGLLLQVGDVVHPLVASGDAELLAEGLTISGRGVQEVLLIWEETILSEASTRAVPGWLSILPPLLAIVVALIFRNVIPALFLGIWFGSWTIAGLSIGGLWSGLLNTYQVYVLGAITDPSRASIILFSFMIGGMVGIISKNGGMQGVVNRIIPWASSPKRGQVATGALGLIIFFDDYANTLVVGNTMRKVTDRLRISREKLAYIVDSTAAPVTCVAFVTTWIGYEVGLIGVSVERLEGFNEAPYSIFLSSIPYNFYPLLAMFYVFVVSLSQRDFGPMYKAEVRARTKGQVLSPDADVDEAAVSGKELKPRQDKPHRPINAVVPVLVLIFGVLGGLYVTGEGESLRDIIGSADSYKALMWASLLGAISAALLSVSQRILTLHETVEAWYAGLKSMLFAMIILVLAWSLSSVSEVLQTADFLVSILGEALHPGLVPTLVFILSAATAFATGSSWGTMGILMPLVLPLTWAVLLANDMANPSHYHIIYSTVACVLAGAVWGDHCSPISDTTILSSMASGCDHIDHVRTQLPYAVLVGGVGVILGTLPAGFGLPWWVGLPVGAMVLLVVHRWLGKTVVYAEMKDDESPAAPAPA